jgi:DNA-binding NarL/FixJ family response regulator
VSGGQPNRVGWLAPCSTSLLTRDDHTVGDIRVLVVDDQAPFRRAMAAVVEETDGFVVVGLAATGEEAVDLAATLAPDLVLMDVNLPGIDGLEATRRVRAGSQPPVVLLLSTYDESDGPGFVAESGAAAYVTKSAFGPDQLFATYASALD